MSLAFPALVVLKPILVVLELGRVLVAESLVSQGQLRVAGWE